MSYPSEAMLTRPVLLAALVATLAVGCGPLRCGPSVPELPGALADLPVPPAPVLSPAEELATFRLPPGFRIELVAAEPLVEDPVALAWDGRGRLFVVEMRGFMPDVAGVGEDQPVGRIVILEDRDDDGVMDESHVFLDGLVLPRGVAVLPRGVLIAEPPNLWLCHDRDDDRRCDEKIRLAEYGVGGENVEHTENGLLPGLDGWIYNAKSDRRFRFVGDQIEIGETLFRGQWGIAQDDAGRLYYNTNSNFAFIDPWPAELLLRHPAMRPQAGGVPGVAVDLAPEAEVFGIRTALGANRAYLEGTLREDGRLLRPTGASGIAVQRSPALGEERVGDVFVPEVVGNLVARFSVDPSLPEATRELTPDPTWGQRDFLTSTDERFRPANVSFGPRGELLVVDMYRGIIQHSHYVSDYLRDYIERQGMATPLGLGRIWRVVREDRPLRELPPDPAAADVAGRVALLADAAGPWRDMASRWLVAEGGAAVVAALRDLSALPRAARVGAVWTLGQLGAADAEVLGHALASAQPELRAAGWRVAAEALPEGGEALLGAVSRAAKAVTDPRERILAALALAGRADRPEVRAILARLLAEGAGDATLHGAVFSGLAGRELVFADLLLSDGAWQEATGARSDALRELARLAFIRVRGEATQDPEASQEPRSFVAWLGALPPVPARTALLAGVGAAAGLPGNKPVVLAEPPSLFASDPEGGEAYVRAWRLARRGVTWIGDENVPGAVPLTEGDKQRMAQGKRLYDQSCIACHQAHGHGQAGLAPPLAGSPWVLDSDGWLTRIVLQGLRGPVEVLGTSWDLVMPPHGHDPRFDDETVAGLLTFLRRSWGHTGAPVSPQTVAAVRDATADRKEPWTVAELLELDVDHVLERYVGKYSVDGFPMSFTVSRERTRLRLSVPLRGETELTRQEDGSFSFSDGTNEGLLHFLEEPDGAVSAIDVVFGIQNVRLTRVE